jgi:Co/Zn/Cd efflux system component
MLQSYDATKNKISDIHKNRPHAVEQVNLSFLNDYIITIGLTIISTIITWWGWEQKWKTAMT